MASLFNFNYKMLSNVLGNQLIFPYMEYIFQAP